MDINIDSLIQEGKAIRKDLKYVTPPSNVWRTYDVFKLGDSSKYYAWSAICFRFLSNNYHNDNMDKLFQEAACAFEEKSNHLCPAPLDKMIGILESCKALPNSTSKPLETITLDDEILNIDKAYSIYQSFTHSKYNSSECITAYHNWYSSASVLFSKFFPSGDDEYQRFREVDNSGNGMVLHDNYAKVQAAYHILLSRIKSGAIKQLDLNNHNTAEVQQQNKLPLLFISHSSEDESIVEPLVSMLQKMGFNKTNLFCSSVEGYGIDEGEDIYDTLRNKFLNANIYVVFVLSHNYYSSPACLNEMGAAWVLQSEYSTIVAPKFKIPEIKGAINPRRLAIVLDDNKHIRSSLNKFRERILGLFNLTSLDDDIVWENIRNDFIKAIQMEIPNK